MDDRQMFKKHSKLFSSDSETTFEKRGSWQFKWGDPYEPPLDLSHILNGMIHERFAYFSAPGITSTGQHSITWVEIFVFLF